MRPKVYIPLDNPDTPGCDWLELLAGDDPALRTRAAANAPNATAISVAAGLDSTTLLQLKNGQIGLSSRVMAALVGLLVDRGATKDEAQAELFDLVNAEDADAYRARLAGRASRERQAVAA